MAQAQRLDSWRKRSARRSTSIGNDAIAVIGMAGRFPGASTVEGFWDNLVAGRDTVNRFTVDTLDPAALDASCLDVLGPAPFFTTYNGAEP